MTTDEQATLDVQMADIAARLGRADANELFERAQASLEHALRHRFVGIADDCLICLKEYPTPDAWYRNQLECEAYSNHLPPEWVEQGMLRRKLKEAVH